MGYAVALGLKARIALVKEDWNTALTSATDAITASGKTIQDVGDFVGMNDATAGNVMWGVQIPADDVNMYASLWIHMSYNQAYGQGAPKEISKCLYNKISATDSRQAWWTNDYGLAAPVQTKFEAKEGTECEGDYIWMRVEEMYLTAAEAACRLGRSTSAKNYLNTLMSKRDPNYSCNKTGTALGALTTDETGSLLEEILIQRRIELWGEDGRIYTIRRLRQGFARSANDGWPNGLLLTNRTLNDPESYPWVLTIPQSEFYNYYSRMILAADQNPLGDTYETPEDVERTPQHLSFAVATQSYEVSASSSVSATVNLTRPNTSSKPYYALLCLTREATGAQSWYYVYFAPNQRISSVTIPFQGTQMDLGRYTYTLSLTDLEKSVANSSQITSTKLVFDVLNFGADGQHISFATAHQDTAVYEINSVDIPVTITRAVTTYDYRARITLGDHSLISVGLVNDYIFFQAGESTATATLRVSGMELGQHLFLRIKAFGCGHRYR